MTARRPLVAGNWKMNGHRAALKELADMGTGNEPALRARVDLLVCPPATLVHGAALYAIGTGIAIGAQDCHAKTSGAHTGDISAAMLADAGASHVIVGHSERRADHGESNDAVKAKAMAVHAAGLTAIICIGETRSQREAGKTLTVTRRQLRGSLPEGATARNTVIAYEPVWAIGTGLVPTLEDVAEVHADIRKTLKSLVGRESDGMRVLYGGSVKPDNAKALLSVANVDGALVGGASLKAADFLAIAAAYR